MNTVMDDNKKLCLTSGETIKMTKWMKLVFEAIDLQHSTPATVSRLGIVFLQSKNQDWENIIESYFLKDFPTTLIKYKVFI